MISVSLYQILLFSIILIFGVIESVQDLRSMKVDLWIQLFSIFCVVILHLVFNVTEFFTYIISAFAFGGFYFLIRLITKGKLGWADVIFGIFQGFCLKPFELPVCVIMEVLFPLIAILLNKCFILLAHKEIKTIERIPFIPFMVMGLVVTVII